MLRDPRRMTCPHCGQPLTSTRLGVQLGPLRARLLDAVRRAGQGGISGADLFDLIFAERGVKRSALKTNVWVINDLIADSGWRIVSTKGTDAHYWLVRRKISRYGRPARLARKDAGLVPSDSSLSASACGPNNRQRIAHRKPD